MNVEKLEDKKSRVILCAQFKIHVIYTHYLWAWTKQLLPGLK